MIDIVLVLWNFIVAFVNFLGNVFTDPIGAIARLFFDLADCILNLLQSVANAIDTIFGSNLASSVQGWRDDLDYWVDDTFGQGEEIMAKVDTEDYHLDSIDYMYAFDKGAEIGDSLSKKIGEFDPASIFGKTDIPDPEQYTQGFDNAIANADMANSISNIDDNTDKIKDSVEITEEDLKYLRDIAEQEAINRFTTAEITIEQTNNNNVSGEMDLDGIVTGLTDAVNEAVDIIAEGVHE